MTYTIRAARIDDASAIARVRVDSWRTTYQGLLPEAYLANLSYEQSVASWRSLLEASGRQGYTYVVEAPSQEVVGFIVGGQERDGNPTYDAELYAIYLLQAHQHHGLGRRLVQALTQHLLEERATSMLVWMLKGNPAARFYQALGGVLLSERDISIAGRNFREISFGWSDIRPLAGLPGNPLQAS